jgi:hypothetical protein
VLAGRVISCRVTATLLSGSTFRNGDWLRETLSAFDRDAKFGDGVFTSAKLC